MADPKFYETPDWGPQVEKNFYKRLMRCTEHYQPQYAYHKAIVLTRTGDPVRVRAAIELCRWILDTYRDIGMAVNVKEQMAEACLALGDLDAAIVGFRDVLRIEREHPKLVTRAGSQYAAVVISRNLKHLFGDVLGVLQRQENAGHMTFPQDLFLMHAARAVIAHARGEWAKACRAGLLAMEAAGREHSGMTKHPKLGLVDPSQELIGRVERILKDRRVKSAGESMPPEPKRPAKLPKDPVAALNWKLQVQLSELGLEVKEIGELWDMPRESYTHALPTLVRFLGGIPIGASTKKLRRTLLLLLQHDGLRQCKEAADILLRVYRTSDVGVKWDAALVIARIAKKEHTDWVLGAIQDPRNGTGRDPLLVLLKKLIPDRAEGLLLRMLKEEPEHPIWKLRELGFCGTARSISRIESYLRGEEDVRTCAKTAIKKIRARMG